MRRLFLYAFVLIIAISLYRPTKDNRITAVPGPPLTVAIVKECCPPFLIQWTSIISIHPMVTNHSLWQL